MLQPEALPLPPQSCDVSRSSADKQHGWRSVISQHTDNSHAALSTSRGTCSEPKDFDWLRKNIPCQAACPAGTDIPGYLARIADGDYDAAYRINLRDNVFPGVLGRVCSRPCEAACRHGWEGLGDSVAICHSKRAAADMRQQGAVVLENLFAASDKRVAVVGAGVGGLATARDLARFGHAVTVYEKHETPGGMLNQGIPVFRLPRDIIHHEIEQVKKAGVTIQCGTEIGVDITLSQLLSDFDAVVMAAGTLKPNIPNIPGAHLPGVEHGLPFLLEVNERGRDTLPGAVIVIGGGFTSMDCARTALRMNSDSVAVYYRRSVDEMLVTPGELEELATEGIELKTNVTPVAFVAGDDGRVAKVRFAKTQLSDAVDISGRRRPQIVEGSEFEVAASAVLLATGQEPDISWIDDALANELIGEDGRLKSGIDVATARDKLFAAGDFALGATTLIDAIGHGRGCARAVDTFLAGSERLADAVRIEDAAVTGRNRDMDDIPLNAMPTIPIAERGLTAEVESGFAERLATSESTRCYLCSYKFEIDNDECIYCDGCLRVKPHESCIIKVDTVQYADDGCITGYVESTGAADYNLLIIDQEQCTRCGACMEVCPVECISLQEVKYETQISKLETKAKS
jgi:formate dehydrogenase major subunit